MEFVFQSRVPRVVFGAGALRHLERELDLLQAKRALILATPEQAGQAKVVADRLGARCAGVFDRAAMHVPVEVAREARAVAQQLEADCAVAVGGGSTTGLGKAIALESSLPILAVPTTYAGSEMTPIWGITENGRKKTGRDARVLPRAVIYDPELTHGLPSHLSAVSGMNAIAHAVEGLYAQDANPVASLMAEEGIRALAQGLPAVVRDGANADGRALCLYGAWLCGAVLGSVGMALHHKLCHTLGGTWGLPHAETHTAILPHAVAYNRSATDAMSRIARGLGVPDAAAGLYDLAVSLGAPTALRDLGMPEADLDRAVELALESPYYNPRTLERGALRSLLQDAWAGRRPSSNDTNDRQ
jgi:maleylacetate reductase